MTCSLHMPCFLPCPHRGSRITRGVASVLAATLRAHRAAPAWWRRVSSVPFRLFTGVLRKHLGTEGLQGRQIPTGRMCCLKVSQLLKMLPLSCDFQKRQGLGQGGVAAPEAAMGRQHWRHWRRR